MIKILFVCLGNICRSPTAEAVLRHKLSEKDLLQQCFIDSAGTSAFHEGASPDERSQQAARKRGYDMRQLRSRPVTSEDYEAFDYLIAMDENNLQVLEKQSQNRLSACPQITLLLSYANDGKPIPTSVPDPYYGGEMGFDYVLDLIERACDGLIEQLFSA